MTHWQCTVDLVAEWEATDEGKLTPKELAEAVVVKLKQTTGLRADPEMHDILVAFGELGEEATFDDFDVVLEKLYDWADRKHRLWVKTF